MGGVMRCVVGGAETRETGRTGMRFAVTSEISADHDKLEQDHADAAAHYFHNAVRILTESLVRSTRGGTLP
jgi:hypothetical protein